jgi:AraC-like DNA-binding protein
MLNQELFFNLGDVFEVSSPDKHFTTGLMSSWLTGLHTHALNTYATGKHLSIGILFKPWGVYQAFGLNASDIANKAIDPEILFGGALRSFVEEKAAVLSLHDFLASLETHLLSYYKPRPVKQHVIHMVDGLELNGLHKGKMSKLANELKLSSKAFIETFNTTVGVSPVKYYHLRTIRQALTLIEQYPQKSLTEIALECGFFDQAHFIRVFRSFCGIAPKQHRNNILAAKVNSVQF